MGSRKGLGPDHREDEFSDVGTGLSPLENRSLASKLLSRCRRVEVNKPLIPLKVCLFFFFGGAAAIAPFLQVFIVQLGITVKQLSIMYMINPVVYFVGPAISGVVADKIGHAKPVFVANMLLAVVSLNCMLLIPSLRTNCLESAFFECLPQGLTVMNHADTCPTPGVYPVLGCDFSGKPFDETNKDDQNCTDCKGMESHLLNLTTVLITVPTGTSDGDCPFITTTSVANVSSAVQCPEMPANNYTIRCRMDSAQCVTSNDRFAVVFSVVFVLMMTFTTVMSNCYRMLDVTAMSMVKDHDSDFGRVRFWSILSSAIVPPLVGLLVDHFTIQEASKYYAVAFYSFDFMMVITSIAVWKLDVRINPPGKKMWKKTLALLGEPEFLAFSMVLLVLGTNWGFTRNFSNIYLKQLGASSLLLGLITATNSVAGLPFLVTSNWWVKQMGTCNIMLLGFVGYIAYCIGYFLMINPWLAILYELTTVLTYHLLWVAVVRHSHETAPDGLVATVIASAGGIHYGIGKGTGSLVGGWVKSSNENSVDPLAYLAAAGTCAISALSYGSFLFCRKSRERLLVLNQCDKEKEVNADENRRETNELSSI